MWPQLLAFAVGAGIAWSPVWDYDVWFQLACGRAIVALRDLPAHDLFSWTAASRPWDTQEWLSQVIGYGVWALGGLAGLTAAKALVAGAILWLVWRRSVRPGPNQSPAGAVSAGGAASALAWLSVAAAAFAAYVMRWHLVERPQVLTYMFVAVELLMLETGRSPWVLVPLTVLWANLHGGSSLLAPGIFALWTLGRAATGWRERRTVRELLAALPAGIALLAAIIVNPAGPKLFLYPWETMSDRMYMANVLEWLPPTFGEQPEFFVWLVAAALLVLLTIRRHGIPALLAASVLSAFALLSRRHIPLACVALTPLAVRGAAGLCPTLPRGLAGAIAAAACALSVGWAAVHGEALRGGVRADLYPAGAVVPLRDAPLAPGRDVRIYTLHRWGGYLEWLLPPRFKVFIDGRQLVHGRDLFANYYRILENTLEAPVLLRLYSPDVFVLGYGAKVTPRLAADRDLALAHWDDTCLVYLRRTAVNTAWLKSRAYTAYHPETGPIGPAAQALAELARAARETPGAARPWTARSRLLLSLNRLDEAEEAAREALQRAPGVVPVLLTAFDVAVARRDAARAAELVRQARRADSRGPAPVFAAARLAYLTGDLAGGDSRLADAIHAGEAMENRGPTDPALADALRLLADRRISAGDRGGASDALRRAGNASYHAGAPGDALACYRRALALTPSDMRILHNMGTVLVAEGRALEALAVLRQALTLDPRSPDTLSALGVAHYRLGDLAAARIAWKRALEINPDHADAKGYLQAIGP